MYVCKPYINKCMAYVCRLPLISTLTGRSQRLAVLASSTSTSSPPRRTAHTHTLRSAPTEASAIHSKAPAIAFKGLQETAAWSRTL